MDIENKNYDVIDEVVEASKNYTNLNIIHIIRCQVYANHKGKSIADGLKHCRNLMTLNLKQNSLCADGCNVLADGLKHCNNLLTLNLKQNSIGGEGAKAIADGLKYCSNLQTLDL